VRTSGRSDPPFDLSEADRQPQLQTVTPGRRRLPAVAWLALLAIVVLVARPWGTDPPPVAILTASPIPAPTGTPAPQTPPPAPSPPTPAPTLAHASDWAPCYSGDAWRLVVIAEEVEWRQRIWYAIEPSRVASGPRDGPIPSRRVFSDGIVAVGFCAPTEDVGLGPNAALVRSSGMTVWVLSPEVDAEFSHMAPLEPPVAGVAELYRSPWGEPWPPGDYVFHVGAEMGLDSWFGLSIFPSTRR